MKDLLNLVCGEMLFASGFNPEYMEQQFRLMIIMVGSNPFF